MQNLYLVLRIFYIWKSLKYEKIAFYMGVKQICLIWYALFQELWTCVDNTNNHKVTTTCI